MNENYTANTNKGERNTALKGELGQKNLKGCLILIVFALVMYFLSFFFS